MYNADYMRKYFYLLAALTLLLAVDHSVHAGEIKYGHVEDVRGREIFIEYKGPAGVENFVCDALSVQCEPFGTSTPSLFPEIDGASDYANSSDGKYGVVGIEGVNDTGSTTHTHIIYDVSEDSVEVEAVVPYTKKALSYKFSWAGDHLTIFGEGAEVATYSIDSGNLNIITPEQSEFPLKSLSPHGKYLSAYSYSEEEHRIWDTETGELTAISSETPAFVEFSQDENFAAFIDDREGYQTLYIADLNKKTEESVRTERVFEDDFTVEDYLFFKDDLYAVGNTENNPYEWVLYRYDIRSGSADVVAQDVSYGDYIRPVGKYDLSFITTEGKSSHVALYDPETGKVQTIKAVDPSPASDEIKRSIIEFDETRGVLYEPEDPDRHPDLFVWLHGGPKRQTSVGYHSYLSYAVYDELLERIAESGAYVLKLDYAGSYGHGSEFMDALINNVGVADTKHVIDASREIQDEYDIDDTYLIGNSYGGYLGPKALVEGDGYFDGAIAINGVFDWFTLIERIPSSPFKTYFKGLVELEDLRENFKLYEQASIVKNLPDLDREKLLLIYAEDDSTVPTWQTREFFYLAQALDKNVDLLKLKDEDHIIRKRDSLNEVCEFIADGLSISDMNCSQ